MTNQEIEEIQQEGFPNWLGNSIINNDLPWEAARTYRLDGFLEKYTLHDSYWVTIHHDVAHYNYAILVFEWDAV